MQPSTAMMMPGRLRDTLHLLEQVCYLLSKRPSRTWSRNSSNVNVPCRCSSTCAPLHLAKQAACSNKLLRYHYQAHM